MIFALNNKYQAHKRWGLHKYMYAPEPLGPNCRSYGTTTKVFKLRSKREDKTS